MNIAFHAARGVWIMALPLAMCSCESSKNAAPAVQPAIAVKAEVIRLSQHDIVKTYTATLEGEKQAVIYGKIAEAVDSVHVDEGQRVSARQVLISLDKWGPSSRYQETLSLYKNAEKNYQKMDYLFKEGAVSESQFDAALTQYEVAKAGFEAAAQLVEIRSPIDGIVTSLNVSKGDYLSPGEELATVATVDRLRAKFGVNAADVAYITPGARVTVSAEGIDVPAEGTVSSIARSANSDTRTFQTEVIVRNSGQAFRPGMFVRVNVIQQHLTDAVIVPRQALVIRGAGQKAFVVVGGVARQRNVTAGTDLGGQIVVTSGLTAGDTLVTLGQDYLQDGAPVKITQIASENQ
ncbi:MAG TPA: efflux RND transporter periplasmic adaptor subunit [Candidatus Deferrimicrobium sp.]|nr:efflux RND transporter periplasmic adaptor subunit [Candidatus Deferrimicrobium sp.]